VTLPQSIAPSLSSTSGVLLNSFTANGQSYASQSLLTDAAPGLTRTAQIPEPSTVTLLGGGLLALLMVRRKAGRLIGGPRMSRQQG
jgi:hypothetical protein